MAERKTILGIDPGTNKMGYGVISVLGKNIEYVAMGYIDLSKFSDSYSKLRYIFERVSGLCETYQPSEVALEAPFYGENVQSMLKLGRAQGVAMAAVLVKGCSVAEYAPRRIKISVTGSGEASKEQVANILKSLLKFDRLPSSLDSTDALAVAVCHHYQTSSGIFVSSSKAGGWENFIKNNPDRIIKK